jgi:hypothetical protein
MLVFVTVGSMSQDAGFRYFICLILNTTVGTYVRRMKTKLLPHQHVHSTAVRLKTAGSAKLLIFVKKRKAMEKLAPSCTAGTSKEDSIWFGRLLIYNSKHSLHYL